MNPNRRSASGPELKVTFDLAVFPHDLVGPPFDVVQLGRCESLKVRDVDARALDTLVRAGLPDVGAEELTQRSVEDVRRRVVLHQLHATRRVDSAVHALAGMPR